MSWKPEVIADSSGKWAPNGCAYATEEEAEKAVSNLMMRWMAVTKTRVVESEQPVNARWDIEKGTVMLAPTGMSVEDRLQK